MHEQQTPAGARLAPRRIAVYVGASGQRSTYPVPDWSDTIPARITTAAGEDRHLVLVIDTSDASEPEAAPDHDDAERTVQRRLARAARLGVA
jgi:hypothetical protein